MNRSKGNSFSSYIAKKVRSREPFGVSPVLRGDRDGLNQNPGVHQYIKCQAREFLYYGPLIASFENEGQVSVAVGPVVAPRARPKEDGPLHLQVRRNPVKKNPYGPAAEGVCRLRYRNWLPS